jgi:hypothetical protein
LPDVAPFLPTSGQASLQKQDDQALRTHFRDQASQTGGTQEHSAREPLGVGTLIGSSFRIMLRHLLPVLLIGFVTSLLRAFLAWSMVGIDAALNLESNDASNLAGLRDFVTACVDVLEFATTAACLAQLTYDARLNRPVSIARYLLPALRATPAICLQNSLLLILFILIALPPIFSAVFFDTFVISIITLGVLPFIALWGCSVFLVLAPAVVIERAGFGGLKRCWSLTKTYRWQIAGAVLPVWLYSLAIALAGAFPVEFLARQGHYAWALQVFAATSALASGPLAILASLVHARLREIKEGISVDQVADIFD